MTAAIHHRARRVDHVVVVDLRAGPYRHACKTEGEAVDLFEALREIRPNLSLQRLVDGRAVEISGAIQ